MMSNTIGNNIKKLRKESGMTQEQISVKLCMSRQTLSNYETGKRIPAIYELVGLANVFKVSLDTIVGRKV